MATSFKELLSIIQAVNPDIKLIISDHFSWDPKSKVVSYSLPESKEAGHRHSSKLLHELAHAKLMHSDYRSDIELLKIESSAWSLARQLAKQYNTKLSQAEQDESLQSYINWASSRSKCPKCQKNGLQNSQTEFICPNCSNNWKVSKSRFTRTYRR